MHLLRKSKSKPKELVEALGAALASLEKSGDAMPNATALVAVGKKLRRIKDTLYSASDADPQKHTEVCKLSHELHEKGLLLLLVQHLDQLDFESKKNVTLIFNNLLHRMVAVHSFCAKPALLFALMTGYERPEIALHCGSMLRECIRFQELAEVILHSDGFIHFFRYIQGSSFIVAADAFSTFKKLLTQHSTLTAEYLSQHYDRFFTHYDQLLRSENYVIRLQSLKLLGNLLFDRHHFAVMMKYISSPNNLKLIMNMLKETSRNIQLEAFHVFKLFIANPTKPSAVLTILLRNQTKLIDFLNRFHIDRGEEFNEDRSFVIMQIQSLRNIEES
ncbi:protein Mo25-like [Anopheles aquasalis]|uniref:protein Mo25-like n=1 Tax=Anopheles aquasalis TaxID=42839 RepID=UPI00215B3717|nr:protein Mo25-like [Anopheles aquasalis]